MTNLNTLFWLYNVKAGLISNILQKVIVDQVIVRVHTDFNEAIGMINEVCLIGLTFLFVVNNVLSFM